MRARLAEAEQRLHGLRPEGGEATPGDGRKGEHVLDPNERERTHQAPAGAAVVVQDVTDLRRTEEALRRAHDRLVLAQEAAGAGTWDWDLQNGTMDWSAELFRLFGLDPARAEASFETWRAVLYPDDLARATKRVDAALRSRTRLTNEYRIRLPSGDLRWIRALGDIVCDASGRALRMSGICLDVTESKRAEETLRSEEATLRGILDATQESIWLFSPEGRMLMGNTIAFQRFGKPPADIIGKHFNEILPAELARTRLARLREVVEFARPVDFEDERCGISFHHRFYPVLDAAGQVTSVACFSRDVTERKRSDGERVQLLTRLREQHAELDAVLAAIQDVVLIYDKDGTVRLVNRACVPAYGFDPTNHSLRDILRRNFYHDLDGRPLDVESVPTARALRGESVRNAQCVVRQMDGAEAAWEISSTPLRIGDEIVGAVTVWHDITERKKAEERLRQSEALYRAIGESIDYGVWTCAPDGRNTYASESFLKLVGLTQEQCSNFGWGAVLHPDDAHRTIEAWKECVRQRGMWDIEHRVRGVDGQYHAVLARGVPVLNDRGEVVCWAGINLDIGRLKRAEEELRQLNAKLEQRVNERTAELTLAAQYARSLIEASLDPLVTISPDGRITDANRATELATGVARDELVGSDFSNYFTDPDRARAGYRQVIAEGLVRDYALTLRHASGHTMDVLYNATVYCNAAGEVQGIFAAARDITHRNRAEEQLKAANRDLEAFCYSVSHDLRAPLRGIDGFSQALLEDYLDRLDAEGQGHLRWIRSECQRMGCLIDDLLNLSRVGRVAIERKSVDLTALAREIVAGLLRSAGNRSVRFQIADGLRAEGDSHLLRAALSNLLDNAWKYTAKRPDAEIEFGSLPLRALANPPEWLGCPPATPVFFVRDNGVGFDMAYAHKLFAPFQRLHSAKEFPGTGIGLAIAHRVVHRHGGHIWTQAAVDRGATFYFVLTPKGH